MPKVRPDIREIAPYVPGRPIADVAREHGFDPTDIVKLASNECPVPPLAAVQDVMHAAVEGVYRYPDNDSRDLRHAIADTVGISADSVWVGAGSSEILRVIALSLGGPGTTAVYAWPSFVVYRLASIVAMSGRVEVPLAEGHVHDLDAMAEAVDDSTSVVYVCNPNNPTGTVRPASDVEAFIDRIPSDVLVVVDEAYHEYVDDPEYRTALPIALERPNVVVTRTFSKIHGLASLRVGYAFGMPDTLREIRKSQAPFTVGTIGQAAALESLRHPADIAQRAADNAAGRETIETGLSDLDVDFVPSQANFVYFRTGQSAGDTSAAFIRHGVILRAFEGGWVRVSVGTDGENERFLAALAAERDTLRG